MAIALLTALLALGLGACATSARQDAASGTREQQAIVFPVQDATDFKMEAGLEGTLVQRGRCLHISGRRGSMVLPIWPHGFSYQYADGRIFVLDPEEEKVAEVGSPVSMGGGIFGEGEAPLPVELRPRVKPCDGPYWIVGDVLPVE